MPYKNKKDNDECKRLWYEANKKIQLARQQERRTVLRVWFKEYKSTLKCNRCGERHPACLQFHHIDPTKKEILVSAAMSASWSKERILAEIQKCEVLCANCHFKEHWKEEVID